MIHNVCLSVGQGQNSLEGTVLKHWLGCEIQEGRDYVCLISPLFPAHNARLTTK